RRARDGTARFGRPSRASPRRTQLRHRRGPAGGAGPGRRLIDRRTAHHGMIGAHLTGDVTSVSAPGGVVTLVEGRCFCLSSAAGDITPTMAQGLFVLDVRALSRWEL